MKTCIASPRRFVFCLFLIVRRLPPFTSRGGVMSRMRRGASAWQTNVCGLYADRRVVLRPEATSSQSQVGPRHRAIAREHFRLAFANDAAKPEQIRAIGRRQRAAG